MHYHQILRRFYNSKLLVMPDTAHVLSDLFLSRGLEGPPGLRGRAGGGDDDSGESMTYFPSQQRGDGSIEAHAPRASRFYGDVPYSDDGARRPLPFRRTAEGTAIVTCVGEWVNRGAWIGASSGVISYEGFKHSMIMAALDDRTRNILIDFESPGGEAVGAFEAAQLVREVAEIKPVVAMVNGMAASAAYAIASACTSIMSIPTGISGSIGVVMMHLDISEHLKKEGIKPTFIHAGAHKVEGNPYEALPDAVRDRFQADIDTFYGMFIETVMLGRPNLTEQAIRGTEAGCFMGRQAVDIGLVDDIGTFEEVLSQLSIQAPSGRATPTGASTDMTTRSTLAAGTGLAGLAHLAAPIQPGAAAPGALAGVVTADAHNAAVEAARKEGFDAGKTEGAAEGHAKGVAEGTKAGATAERARISGILGCDEAKGRGASASHLALNTEADVDTAKGMLTGLAQGADLDARMEGRKDLNLDAEAPAGGKKDPKTEAADWSTIADSVNAKAGFKRP